MRILFVVEHFPCISETFVLNQVTGLLDLGHDVEIYPIGKPVAPVVHPDFVKYKLETRTWTGPKNPPTRMKRILRAAIQLPRSISLCPRPTLQSLNVFRYGREAANLYLFYSILPFLENHGSYDIVHCHFGDKGALAQKWQTMGLINRRMSVVFHAHEMAGLSDDRGRALYARLFESNALILPISDFWRRLLLRWGAHPDRTFVHHMGVNCEQIQFRLKALDPAKPIRLLSVCRLTEMKGIEYALRAVAQLRARFPSVQHTIVGSGPLQRQLESLAFALGIADCITFAGPQPQDKVQEYLSNAHIFLAPSVTDAIGCTEGIPVALMEAMAAGVPPVATWHAGNPELITDGVSGFLVNERDATQLAAAIRNLVDNPTLYKQVTLQARDAVEKNFNLRKLNERLENIFKAYVSNGLGTPLV